MFKKIGMTAVVASLGFTSQADAMPVEFAGALFGFEYVTTANEVDDIYTIAGSGGLLAGLDPLFTTPDIGRYFLEYDVSIDDGPSTSGISSAVLTEAETDAIIADALADLAFIVANKDTTLTLPGGLGTFTYDYVDQSTGADALEISFGFEGSFSQPVSQVFDTLFADELSLLSTFIPELANYAPNDNGSGSFFGFAIASVAPVPVPASMSLMVLGLGGLIVMRRRKHA